MSRDTVAVTWAANFEAVESSAAAARRAADQRVSRSEAIPFELFLEGASDIGDAIADALDDPDELTMAEMLRPLMRYSLIRSDPTLRTSTCTAWCKRSCARRPARRKRTRTSAGWSPPSTRRCRRLTSPRWPCASGSSPHVMAIAPWSTYRKWTPQAEIGYPPERPSICA